MVVAHAIIVCGLEATHGPWMEQASNASKTPVYSMREARIMREDSDKRTWRKVHELYVRSNTQRELLQSRIMLAPDLGFPSQKSHELGEADVEAQNVHEYIPRGPVAACIQSYFYRDFTCPLHSKCAVPAFRPANDVGVWQAAFLSPSQRCFGLAVRHLAATQRGDRTTGSDDANTGHRNSGPPSCISQKNNAATDSTGGCNRDRVLSRCVAC